MLDIWSVASIIAKFLMYLGMMGAMGHVLILLIFNSHTHSIHRQTIRRGEQFAALALVASVASFLLRGAALTGDISGLYDQEILGMLWGLSVGDVLIIRIIGSILMLLGLVLGQLGLWVALIGGGITLWSFAQIGHIPDTERFWVQMLLFAHLFTISFWIGVLSPLRWLSQKRETYDDASQLGHQFGQIAMIAVPVLIVAGGVMAWFLLADPGALFTTGYGQMLLLKIALIAILLGLAALNKIRFIPEMQNGNQTAAVHLERSIRYEWIAVLAILLTTAILTSVLSLHHPE